MRGAVDEAMSCDPECMPTDVGRKPRPERAKVIVICGSSRFVDLMAVVGWFLERDEGAIAMGLHLLPWWYSEEPIPDHVAEHEGVAGAMDELHLRKIDLADEVFVVNHTSYIGTSTTREIEYARANGKPLRWFTHDPLGEKVLERLQAAIKLAEAATP